MYKLCDMSDREIGVQTFDAYHVTSRLIIFHLGPVNCVF